MLRCCWRCKWTSYNNCNMCRQLSHNACASILMRTNLKLVEYLVNVIWVAGIPVKCDWWVVERICEGWNPIYDHQYTGYFCKLCNQGSHCSQYDQDWKGWRPGHHRCPCECWGGRPNHYAGSQKLLGLSFSMAWQSCSPCWRYKGLMGSLCFTTAKKMTYSKGLVGVHTQFCCTWDEECSNIECVGCADVAVIESFHFFHKCAQWCVWQVLRRCAVCP